ncbi:MAG: hypothetical protein ACI8WM_000606, partial [Burkholderiaceae bacterium]
AWIIRWGVGQALPRNGSEKNGKIDAAMMGRMIPIR